LIANRYEPLETTPAGAPVKARDMQSEAADVDQLRRLYAALVAPGQPAVATAGSAAVLAATLRA